MSEVRAFLDISMATTDGSRVKLDGLDLVVDASAPHLRPMLSHRAAATCVGFRPWIDLINHGSGAVEAPSLRISFGKFQDMGPDDYVPEVEAVTEYIDVPVRPFAEGTTVFLAEALARLGVDTATLASHRFSCPAQDELETCAANLLQSVDFGAVSGLVESFDHLLTLPVRGEFSYAWTDAWGERNEITESFSTSVTLAQLEVQSFVAEMGDGAAFAAPAPDFQDIALPVPAEDLRINLPLRGNPNVSSASAAVQLHADQSSIHFLRVEARLGDGTVQSSMPMRLYYLAPKDQKFATEARPGACYLRPDF